MNQKITTFYRLTEAEKKRLVEQCRKRIEEEKIRDEETVRKILEELLDTKWETKRKKAQTEMQKLLDDLQRQVTQAQVSNEELKKELRSTAGTRIDLEKKLGAAEIRNSELSGDLALANGKANHSQDRLKASEQRVVSLAEQLSAAEKKVTELTGQLSAAGESTETLRRLYSASEKMVANLRKLHSEDARRIEELENDLSAKEREAEANAAEARKARKEAANFEEQLTQERTQHEKENNSLDFCSALFGVILASILCMLIFPTQYITDFPVPAERNSGVSGTYTGGGNMFDLFSGFGELLFDDGTVCRGFWASGVMPYATEYVFPDGGVYSGAMGFNNRPFGAGIYTRWDGEKVFGLWTWAQEETVKVGADEVEYIYTGPLLFEEPYGYGVFYSSDGNEQFVGEFYDDCFMNGTWTGADGTERKINNQ